MKLRARCRGAGQVGTGQSGDTYRCGQCKRQRAYAGSGLAPPALHHLAALAPHMLDDGFRVAMHAACPVWLAPKLSTRSHTAGACTKPARPPCNQRRENNRPNLGQPLQACCGWPRKQTTRSFEARAKCAGPLDRGSNETGWDRHSDERHRFRGSRPRRAAERHDLLTQKSLDQFGGCFVEAQDRSSMAWSFVPKADGGTFSNLGARGGANHYFLAVSDRGMVAMCGLNPPRPACRWTRASCAP